MMDNRELQIKSHLKWKKFKNGCDEYDITEQDLIDTIFIGGTNNKYKLFLNYNLKKYNIDLTKITTYPKQSNKCLCHQSLINLFYLYNQKKHTIYVIGSECITNFNNTKIKLTCINCQRSNAKQLHLNGLCNNCLKLKCNNCYDNYIYKNKLCIKCHLGKCEGCLSKINNKYKYCYFCNQKKNKILCSICKIKYHDLNFNCCFNCFQK